MQKWWSLFFVFDDVGGGSHISRNILGGRLRCRQLEPLPRVLVVVQVLTPWHQFFDFSVKLVFILDFNQLGIHQGIVDLNLVVVFLFLKFLLGLRNLSLEHLLLVCIHGLFLLFFLLVDVLQPTKLRYTCFFRALIKPFFLFVMIVADSVSGVHLYVVCLVEHLVANLYLVMRLQVASHCYLPSSTSPTLRIPPSWTCSPVKSSSLPACSTSEQSYSG